MYLIRMTGNVEAIYDRLKKDYFQVIELQLAT